jgi:hypothetical protein
MTGVRNARRTARRAAVLNLPTRKTRYGHNDSGVGGTARAHDDEPNRLNGCTGALPRR